MKLREYERAAFIKELTKDNASIAPSHIHFAELAFDYGWRRCRELATVAVQDKVTDSIELNNVTTELRWYGEKKV